MSNPVYNFSAGPCVLPKQVFSKCAEEMMNYNGTGLCVMEMSHRSKEFVDISDRAKADLRTFLQIPDNFKIFLFQGGASLQYAAIIKNLLKSGKGSAPSYVTTGLWSNQCLTEAKKMLPADNQPVELASSKSCNYNQLSKPSQWRKIDPNSSFVHYCQNETVHGYQFKNGMDDDESTHFPFHLVPEGVPVVCDMSSDIGSRKVDWSKYGMVYAGAQKNLGTSGCTVAIIRDDLIGKQAKDTPFLLDWNLFDKSPSGYFNTPACYPIYVTGLNIAHMIENGGLGTYEKLAEDRSKMLYDMIENSNGFYTNSIDKKFRSTINVPFRINPLNEDPTTYTSLELQFLERAADLGLLQLKGHSSNPGIRVSMYNAMDVDGVEKLIELMKDFEAETSSPRQSLPNISKRNGLKMSNEFEEDDGMTHASKAL